MPKLPYLTSTTGNASLGAITSFKGYDHNDVIDEGSWYDTKNTSSRFYPVLSARHKRLHVANLSSPQGLCSHDHLAWVDDNKLYYNAVEVTGLTLADGEKQLVTMGAYIVIFPDKVMYNTSTGDISYIDNSVSTTGTATVSLSDSADGSALSSAPTVSTTAPSDPDNGALWIDTSVIPHVLKKWYEASGMWIGVATTYVKISAAGIGSGFEKYDGVTISGMTSEKLNGDFYLTGCGADYIVITAIIDATATQTAAVTVSRTAPDMDFVCELSNRLWGCSSENHEIYACALGDPKNWRQYRGRVSDSYAVTVGSPGEFTGCASYGGYLYFFKQNRLLKMYGSKPENYQLSEVDARGVQKGCERSIVTVNEVMLYKDSANFVACDGGMPDAISSALGEVSYKNVVAGSRGKTYYASCQDNNDSWHLLSFDTEYGVWHHEDNTHVLYFAELGDELYFIDSAYKLWSVGGTSEVSVTGVTSLESDVEWYAVSGYIGMESPNHTYVRRITLRAYIPEGASLAVSTLFEDEEIWAPVYSTVSEASNIVQIPIIPRRSSRMRIKINAEGDVKLFMLAKLMEEGTEFYG